MARNFALTIAIAIAIILSTAIAAPILGPHEENNTPSDLTELNRDNQHIYPERDNGRQQHQHISRDDYDDSDTGGESEPKGLGIGPKVLTASWPVISPLINLLPGQR